MMNQQDSKNWGAYANSPPVKYMGNKSACFDWLTVTFSHVQYSELEFSNSISYQFISQLLRLLGSEKKFSDFKTERGRNTYKYSISVSEGINLFFLGPSTNLGNESTMLDISGVGCRELDKKNLWINLFLFLKKYRCHYTRFDLALDDFSGIEYSIYELYSDVKNQSYTSIWKKKPIIYGTPDGEVFKGLTIQFGQRGYGNTLLRVYDKNEEQIVKKGEVSIDSNYWVRWEIQFSDRAEQIIDYYISSNIGLEKTLFTKMCSEILFSLLKIRNKIEGCRLSDCPIKENYLLFINSINEIKTVGLSFNNEVNIDIKVNWVNNSVFKSLAAIYLTYDDNEFISWIMQNIREAILRYDDSMLNAVNNKRSNLTYSKLDEIDLREYCDYILKKYHKPKILKLKKYLKKERLL